MKLFTATLTVLVVLVSVSLFMTFYTTYRIDSEENYDKQLARTVSKRVLADMRVFQSKSIRHMKSNREAMDVFTKFCVHYLMYEDSWIKEDQSKLIRLSDEEIIDNILSQPEFPRHIFLLACRSIEEQEIALRGLILEVITGSHLAYNRKTYLATLYKFLKY